LANSVIKLNSKNGNTAPKAIGNSACVFLLQELYKMLENFSVVFGDDWYMILDRRSSVFCLKDLRLIGRCLWFITVKQ
jgi:hypothetical protein